MARKNNVKNEHQSSISFDTRTRAVMAGPDANDNTKEKVQSVREVVPGKSNNEIVLVLQYYDYNVEKAIQAYLEDGAKEALGEWHVPVAKANKKKKNKKKASDAAASGGAPGGDAAAAPAPSSQSATPQAASTSNGIGSSLTKPLLTNGNRHADSDKAPAAAAAAAGPRVTRVSSPPVAHNKHNHRENKGSHGHSSHSHQRVRTVSERSAASSVGAGGDNHSRRPFHGLEKSIKDLQRQTTSLERLRLLMDHEMERSQKSVKVVFEEMRSHLNMREKQMAAQMVLVKEQAYDVFKMRQEKAALLKVHIERAEKLSESELSELRSDVKHFVADRKIDEELGKTTRFQYDSDHLRDELQRFGEVLPVKVSYTARRPSVSSVASSSPADDLPPSLSNSHLATVLPVKVSHAARRPSVSSVASSSPADDLPNSHPATDNNTMSAEELASLQIRLQTSLKLQGYDTGRITINGSSSVSAAGNADENHSQKLPDSVTDSSSKMKSGTRRRKGKERKGDDGGEDRAAVASAIRPGDSGTSSRAGTPSSTQASAGSSPSPQRGSPRRGGASGGGGYRGRGRGAQGSGGGYRGGEQGAGGGRGGYRGEQGAGGYRGGEQGRGGYRGEQGRGRRGSPHRPNSSGAGGGRGGRGRGGGEPSREGGSAGPVEVNGSAGAS